MGACDTSYGGAEAPPPDAGDAPSSSGDAAVEDRTAPVDAADANAACNPNKPFGTPREVGGLATPNHEGAARLSPDELTAYFHAVRDAGTTDLYVATRTSPSASFTGEARVDAVSSAFSDNHPSISDDGRLLVFGRFSSGTWSIFYAQRANTAAAFAAPVEAPILSGDPGSELQPYLTPGALYYTAYPPDAGERPKIRRAALPVGTKAALAELDSSDSECNPTVTPDELTIYFCSNRPAAGAKGQFDIYVATRATKNEPFTGIKPVEELNTTASEYPDWVSPDGCRLYFTSDRVRGDGSGDVFVAERGR
jgi:Tol biopolymer transport system component